MNRGQLLTLLGGIGLLLGALLPWATLTSILLGVTINKAGYQGDGLCTGAIGLLFLLNALLAKGKPGKMYSLAAVIFAILAGLVAAYDLLSITSASGNSVIASAGIGIYLSLIGAILAFVGGVQKVPARLPAAASAQAEAIQPPSDTPSN